MVRPVLFIDDGGVISDNIRRAAQWRPLVAEYFAPLLGGSPEAWMLANHEVITGILAADAWAARLKSSRDYESFEREYFLYWLTEMCERVGVPSPPEEESIDLSRKATTWIIRQVRADFPGAAAAIRLLSDKGYRLCTASGEPSYDLEIYLGGMGVRSCFDRLYGPDLIGTFKAGPEFYERLLSDAGVSARDALVVDDNQVALDWASELGMRTVQVTSTPGASGNGRAQAVGSLAELPSLLAELEAC